MRLFKKKEQAARHRGITPVTILCIPGSWTDLTEIKGAIWTSSSGEYMVVGEMLISIKRQRQYKIEVCDRDERMSVLFKNAGRLTRISEECLNEIEKHNLVIYISGDTGSLKEAENIAFAGAAILRAGGIGIKIETAGKAFEKERWLDLVKTFEDVDLYQMFVNDSGADKDDCVWSCGMHNLGFKDTIVFGEEFQRAVDLIAIFGYYQIIDKPTILPDQIFQPDAESPQYRITDEPDQPYKDVKLLKNPYGMWRLTKIS
jgi:hypothetical protein